MKPPQLDGLTIIDALSDARLIGDALSPAQECLIRTIYGLPLRDAEQLALYRQATEHSEYVPREHREANVFAGRRAGKSDRIAANIAVFEGCFTSHTLARGERAFVICLAPTKQQSRIEFGYIRGKIMSSPALSSLVEGEVKASEINLRNGVTISCDVAANFKTLRGRSIKTAILSEWAFFLNDEGSANPYPEIVNSILPAMASFKRPKLIKPSSTFARVGPAWEDFCRRGELDVLTWRLPAWVMNPSLSQDFLEGERRRLGAEIFAREFGAEWSDATTGWVASAEFDPLIARGRKYLPFVEGTRYVAALDAAFSSGDRFAFCIGHKDKSGHVVFDLVKWWETKYATLSPKAVLDEVAALLASYRLRAVWSDQWSSQTIKTMLGERHIELRVYNFTSDSKAQLFASLKALISTSRIELLDVPEANRELRTLEVTHMPGGNVRICAPNWGGATDDIAMAIALCAFQLDLHSSEGRGYIAIAGRPGIEIGRGEQKTPHPAEVARFWPRRGRL